MAATQFKYQGLDQQTAKKVSGSVTAPDVATARDLAARKGVILSADPQPKSRWSSLLTADFGSSNKPPKLKEWTQVIRSLATTEQSGVPFHQSMDLIRDGLPEKSRSRAVLTEISKDITDGVSISEAFAARQDIVGEQTVALITAGENSGQLGETLGRLAEMTERQLKQRRQIIGAMSYPGAIFGITMLMAVGILMTVVPTFEEVFIEFEIELPLPTKMMLFVGNTLRSLALILPAVPLFLWLAWRKFMSDSDRAVWVAKQKLGLPLLGKVIHLAAVGRVADVMATMDNAAVPSERALVYAASAAGNQAVARAVRNARTLEQDGTTLAEAFQSQEPIITPVFTTLLQQGAISGKTGLLLANYAVRTDEEVEVRVKALTEALQPIMMLVVMGTVSIIGTAIYLPILEIYDAVSG